MSWDFSTEPEFQEKLDWMRKFVREEVWPLEVVDTDLAGFERLIRPLQEEVKARGLWATHLPPEHGGQGYGQVKLGLMHERSSADAGSPRGSSATRRPTPATPKCSRSAARRSRRSGGCTRCCAANCAAASR